MAIAICECDVATGMQRLATVASGMRTDASAQRPALHRMGGLPHEGIVSTGLSHFEQNLPYITLWHQSWEPLAPLGGKPSGEWGNPKLFLSYFQMWNRFKWLLFWQDSKKQSQSVSRSMDRKDDEGLASRVSNSHR